MAELQDPIRHNDRVLIVGKTDSGKTVLARYLFETFTAARRTAVDPKGRLRLGVDPARRPTAIDLAAPLSHFIPTELLDEEYEEAFRLLWFAGGPRVIWLDESAGPTRRGYAPRFLRTIVQQGREHDVGLIACTQRPVDIEATLRTEAEHVILFVPRPVNLDLKTLAPDMGQEPDALARELDELQAEHGLHSHLWYQRRTGRLTACAPLPASWAHPGGPPPTATPGEERPTGGRITPSETGERGVEEVD